jgi:hypothetical protein
MSDSDQELWFKKKTYGWGWTPVTWQGYLTIIVFIVAVNIYPIYALRENDFSLPVFLMVTFGLVILQLYVCYRKGEKPSWSWGDKK